MQSDPRTPRVSRFSEGTMNSTSSIRVPDSTYMDMDTMDELVRIANGDLHRSTPPQVAGDRLVPAASTSSAPQSNVQTPSEGIFGRFSRAAISLFRGSAFSGLGKRKEREGEALDNKPDRKAEAERAYAEAKALGLLPQPKVFVRPIAKSRSAGASTTATPVTPRDPSAPTPTLYRSASKKDMQKQVKLSKRVSDLEHKLRRARQELAQTLGDDVPPVPAIPTPMTTFPLTPETNTSNFFSQDEVSPHMFAEESIQRLARKITKKRKVGASGSDSDYKPISADEESEMSERGSKKSKTGEASSVASGSTSKRPRKKSSRLSRRRSTVTREHVVIVVPDGESVPAIPQIPAGLGKRAVVSDDGYGGYGTEIF